MQLQKDVGRSCGECNACCKPFSVPEVGKSDGNWCPHCVLGKGCDIYTSRPAACQLYACAWLNGSGDDSYRPDRLGVMIDVADRKLGERIVGEVHLWEMREGALEQQVVSDLAQANLDIGFIVTEHRALTENTYATRTRISKKFFSGEDAALINRGVASDSWDLDSLAG